MASRSGTPHNTAEDTSDTGQESELSHSLTNEVWKVDDRVVKFYAAESWTIDVLNLMHVVFMERPLYDLDRASTAVDAHNRLTSIGINAPTIQHVTANAVSSDFIEGETLEERLSDASFVEAWELGLRVGELFATLHDSGYAVLDARASNLLIDEEDRLWSVDHEFFQQDASVLQQQIDLVTLFSSLLHLETEQFTFTRFRDGFADGYGDRFHDHTALRAVLSFCGGTGYALTAKHSIRKMVQVWKNWVADVFRPVPWRSGRKT